MPINIKDVARHVKVRFVDGHEPQSLSQHNVAQEEYATIHEGHAFNDARGYYVSIEGKAGISICHAYLSDLVLYVGE